MTLADNLPQDLPIERIRKLMAVTTERGASETEAAFAASRVQEILQDFGLSMAEIEGRGGSVVEDGARGRKDADRRAMYRWQVDLMSAIAENNFVKHWVEKQTKVDPAGKTRRSNQHVLLGRKINVDSVLRMYDYLVDTFRRLAKDAGYAHHRNTETEHHLFLGGITERVSERLAEQRRHREREEAERKKAAEAASRHPAYASSSTALVLADVYRDEKQANEDLYNDLRWSKEPGTTGRERAEKRAREAAMKAEFERLREMDVEHYQAWYMAYEGLSSDEAMIKSAQWRATMERLSREAVEHQAKARKSRPPRSRAIYRGPSQAEQRESERRNSSAYRAGRETGNSVGLNAQVSKTSRERLS